MMSSTRDVTTGVHTLSACGKITMIFTDKYPKDRFRQNAVCGVGLSKTN